MSGSGTARTDTLSRLRKNASSRSPIASVDDALVATGSITIRLQIDPNDFFVPQVYSPGDPRWSDANKSVRYAQMCS